MRPGYKYTILSQDALIESGHQRMQNVFALLKVYKYGKGLIILWYAIFLWQSRLCHANSCAKGQNFYKMLLLENWRYMYITKAVAPKRVWSTPHTLFSPDLSPVRFHCVPPKLKFHLSEKKIQIAKCPWVCNLTEYDGCP